MENQEGRGKNLPPSTSMTGASFFVESRAKKAACESEGTESEHTHTQTQLTRADKNYRSHIQRLNRRDRFASPRLGGISHASDKLRKALSPRGERSERRGRKGFARQGVGKASQVRHQHRPEDFWRQNACIVQNIVRCLRRRRWRGWNIILGCVWISESRQRMGREKHVKKAEGIQPGGVCVPWHGGNTLFCVGLPVATVA